MDTGSLGHRRRGCSCQAKGALRPFAATRWFERGASTLATCGLPEMILW
jgi:hypothetical protein